MLRVFIPWCFGFGPLDSWLNYSKWNTQMKIPKSVIGKPYMIFKIRLNSSSFHTIDFLSCSIWSVIDLWVKMLHVFYTVHFQPFLVLFISSQINTVGLHEFWHTSKIYMVFILLVLLSFNLIIVGFHLFSHKPWQLSPVVTTLVL